MESNSQTKGTETKEKKCFVIMPIADHKDYPNGHFLRVYREIIKPACNEAGFVPIRADEVTDSNNIVLDVLKSLVTYDMALCDLSSRNANVFYELGIRHMAKQPVALIKDEITSNVFDVAGIRYSAYHSSLRIDLARQNVQDIVASLRSTYANKETITGEFLDALSIKVQVQERIVSVDVGDQLILDQIAEIRSILSERNINSRTSERSYIYDINGAPLRAGDFIEYVKIVGGNMPTRERNFSLIARISPGDDCIFTYTLNELENGSAISTNVLKGIQMGTLAYRKLDPTWIADNFPDQYRALRNKGITYGFS